MQDNQTEAEKGIGEQFDKETELQNFRPQLSPLGEDSDDVVLSSVKVDISLDDQSRYDSGRRATLTVTFRVDELQGSVKSVKIEEKDSTRKSKNDDVYLSEVLPAVLKAELLVIRYVEEHHPDLYVETLQERIDTGVDAPENFAQLH